MWPDLIGLPILGIVLVVRARLVPIDVYVPMAHIIAVVRGSSTFLFIFGAINIGEASLATFVCGSEKHMRPYLVAFPLHRKVLAVRACLLFLEVNVKRAVSGASCILRLRAFFNHLALFRRKII